MEAPERIDEVLDASGLQCPVPLAKASKALNGLQSGQILKVIATDEGSVLDFQSWSQASKLAVLVRQETFDGDDGRKRFVHYLKRK